MLQLQTRPCSKWEEDLEKNLLDTQKVNYGI